MSSATQLAVDDAHPFLFSSGDWDQQQFTWAFNTTRSLSRNAGAYKVVRFIGTAISVYGGTQPTFGDYPGALSVTQYSIDNGNPTTYAPVTPKIYVSNAYYKSPSLPMGEHVLMMTNMAQDDWIWLDYFVIRGDEGGPDPLLLQSDGARIPTVNKISTTTGDGSVASADPSPSHSSSITTDSIPTISGPTSSKQSTPLTSTVNSTSITHPISPTITTTPGSSPATIPGLSAPVTTYQSTIINADNSQNGSKQRNIPAIASGTCAAVFVTLLILALLTLHRRRRTQTLTQEDTHSSAPYDMENNAHITSYRKMPVSVEGPGSTQATGFFAALPEKTGRVADTPSFQDGAEQNDLREISRPIQTERVRTSTASSQVISSALPVYEA